jgi:acyl-CoA thioesterase FadM
MESPNVPASSVLSFRTRLATRWSDEDNQQVLNNAVYLTLFEEARYRYFASHLARNQFPFLLAQTNVVFVSPGRGGVEVELECGTTHVGNTSFTQAYRVRDAESGRVLCEGEARLVCYDAASGEKRPLGDVVRAAITAREQR